MTRRASFVERAQISRDMAAAHFRIAERTRQMGEQMLRDAAALEAGVDPFRCPTCAELLFGPARRCRRCSPDVE